MFYISSINLWGINTLEKLITNDIASSYLLKIKKSIIPFVAYLDALTLIKQSS